MRTAKGYRIGLIFLTFSPVRAKERESRFFRGSLYAADSPQVRNHSCRLCRSLANRTDCRTNPDRSTIRNTLLKSYKIDTGAHRCAPCRSTFRSPLSLFPAHPPITLTPDTGAAPDAAISLRFCGQPHSLAHIMGEYDTGTMGGISASADAPAARNGGLRAAFRA